MKTRKFVTRILDTQEDEILCSDCLDQVHVYVDLVLDGRPAETNMPRLKHHLDQCTVCQEEFELLYALAVDEETDEDETARSSD